MRKRIETFPQRGRFTLNLVFDDDTSALGVAAYFRKTSGGDVYRTDLADGDVAGTVIVIDVDLAEVFPAATDPPGPAVAEELEPGVYDVEFVAGKYDAPGAIPHEDLGLRIEVIDLFSIANP